MGLLGDSRREGPRAQSLSFPALSSTTSSIPISQTHSACGSLHGALSREN